MKNPEKYVAAKLKVMSAMLKIKDKHSELKHLSSKDRSEIFNEASIRFEKNRLKNNPISNK